MTATGRSPRRRVDESTELSRLGLESGSFRMIQILIGGEFETNSNHQQCIDEQGKMSVVFKYIARCAHNAC